MLGVAESAKPPFTESARSFAVPRVDRRQERWLIPLLIKLLLLSPSPSPVPPLRLARPRWFRFKHCHRHCPCRDPPHLLISPFRPSKAEYPIQLHILFSFSFFNLIFYSIPLAIPPSLPSLVAN